MFLIVSVIFSANFILKCEKLTNCQEIRCKKLTNCQEIRCKKNYENYIYINLEKEEEISSFFNDSLSPEIIIEKIKILKGLSFDEENTIIFIDEIQVNERAITSLKYFCESNIDYKIICAVLFLVLNLIDKIRYCFDNDEKMNDAIHEKAILLYKTYLSLGGMPNIITNYLDENKKLSSVNFNIVKDITNSYSLDMFKYTNNTEGIKNNKIYQSIPRQLAKGNKVFKFGAIEKDARRDRYINSLDWLLASNMIVKCDKTNKNISPLNAFNDDNHFKLYLNDVGILRSLSNISYNEIMNDTLGMSFGVIAENYVATEFHYNDIELMYYTFSKYEIDFLIKINGNIIPVEVKSGIRVSSKSLNEYSQKYNPLYSIRISLKNFGFENNIKSVPLYAVFCINDKN